MNFEKFERALAVLCIMCIVSFVGYCIKDGYKTYDIKTQTDTKVKTVEVDVRGEVIHPGTYRVKENSRICEVIYAAGGITENASVDDMDTDAIVTDGFTIVVPSNGQPANYGTPVVNINTADEEILLLIPGVGDSLASKIVEYREKNGNFVKIEDLMLVKGVGKKNFEKMKDYIKTEE